MREKRYYSYYSSAFHQVFRYSNAALLREIRHGRPKVKGEGK